MNEIKRQVEDLKRWADLLDDAGFRGGGKKARHAAFTIEDLSAKLEAVKGDQQCQKAEKSKYHYPN